MAEKITDESIVSLAELSVVTGITTRRLRQLAEEGVIQPEAKNAYRLSSSVQAYIRYLQKAIPTEEDTKLERAKKVADAKFKTSKARVAQLEAEELEGKMHRSEDVRRITEDMLYSIRNGLTALPGRLAVDVVACNSAAEAFEVIKKEVHRMMREFSDYAYDPNRYEEVVCNRMEWSNSKADGGEDDG